MGAGYSFACHSCGYSVKTSGPWEYYRDAGGRVRPYGHPVPASVEAARAGIWGLVGHVFCPSCRGAKEVILQEFARPAYRSIEVWGGRAEVRPEYREEPTCPDCSGPVYLGNLEGQACPVCRKGNFRGGMEWVS